MAGGALGCGPEGATGWFCVGRDRVTSGLWRDALGSRWCPGGEGGMTSGLIGQSGGSGADPGEKGPDRGRKWLKTFSRSQDCKTPWPVLLGDSQTSKQASQIWTQ